MTMGNISMEERLEFVAEKGKFFCFLEVWAKTIKDWERNGLKIETTPINKGQFRCRISWEDACPIKGKPLNQANRLWLMATEANSKH